MDLKQFIELALRFQGKYFTLAQKYLMEEFLELLKYTVPSIITGVVAYIVIHKMIDQENKRHLMEVRKENLKYTTPVRLQAHERVLLLLERIDPVQVVNRVIKPGMTARNIQYEVIKDIKEEFNHNITQQLYVSKNTWDEVKKAKDDAFKLLTVVATKVETGADAMDFSRMLIQIQAEQEFYTSLSAIETVKKEITKLF